MLVGSSRSRILVTSFEGAQPFRLRLQGQPAENPVRDLQVAALPFLRDGRPSLSGVALAGLASPLPCPSAWSSTSSPSRGVPTSRTTFPSNPLWLAMLQYLSHEFVVRLRHRRTRCAHSITVR